MSFNFLDQGFMPSDSYSRDLDRRVAMDEYPYGYVGDSPPAGYVNQGLLNDAYENERLSAQKMPWDYNVSLRSPEVPRGKANGSFPSSEQKGAYQSRGRLKGK